MIGIILMIIVVVLLYYWYATGKKDRSDIIAAANEKLEDAKAARAAAKIQAETNEVLEETNKIHTKQEN